MKLNFKIAAAGILLTSNVYAAGLDLVADGSTDLDANARLCSKVSGITVSTADELATAMQVSSESISYRGSTLKSGVACCVTLDTPKGPIKQIVWQYYKNGRGKIISKMNMVNVTSSNPACMY